MVAGINDSCQHSGICQKAVLYLLADTVPQTSSIKGF
jgi:hypothetical protein